MKKARQPLPLGAGTATYRAATNGAGTPEGTAQLIREMQEHWKALARELDIQPQ